MNKTQEKNYRKLLDKLCRMYESTLVMGSEAQERIRLQTYWEMGRFMVKAESGENAMVRYGEQVVMQISQDMRKKYGKGFKKRMIYYMRDVGAQFERSELSDELSWNHYRELATVADRARRQELAAKAAAEHWRVSILIQMIRGEKTAAKSGQDWALLLAPKKARLGLGKMVIDSGGAFVDLGFQFLKAVPERAAAGLADGDIVAVKWTAPVKAEGEGAIALSRVDCAPGERYCFDGELLYVVDGDTVRLRVSLQAGCYAVIRLRLRGVGSPELAIEAGVRAKEQVEGLFGKHREVRIITYGWDRYGRWVGDVFFGEQRNRFLNAEILSCGAGHFVDTRTKSM